MCVVNIYNTQGDLLYMNLLDDGSGVYRFVSGWGFVTDYQITSNRWLVQDMQLCSYCECGHDAGWHNAGCWGDGKCTIQGCDCPGFREHAVKKTAGRAFEDYWAHNKDYLVGIFTNCQIAPNEESFKAILSSAYLSGWLESERRFDRD